MPFRNQPLKITYTAWDTGAQAGKAGDGGNHTLKVIVDGVEQSVVATPSEVDGTNAPGEYAVQLTAANMNGSFVKFCGKSSTSGIVIVPIPMTTTAGPPSAPSTFSVLP